MRHRRLATGVCVCLGFMLSVPASVLRADPATPRPIKGDLREIDGVSVLRVWGSPVDRGYAHGYLMADKILEVLDGYVGDTNLSGGPSGHARSVAKVSAIMKIPDDYRREIEGMLAGIRAKRGGKVAVPCLGRKLEYEDLLVMNCIPDSSPFGCSSFAAWGNMTTDGSTIAGRNLDWVWAEILTDSQVIVAHILDKDDGKIAWVSVTWPGFIGCLTGMNAEGVTVSMHDVRAPRSVPSGFTPRAFTLRDAIEAAHARTAREDIEKILRERVCAVGNNIPVALPQLSGRPASYVFEYDGVLSHGKGLTVRKGPTRETVGHAGTRTSGHQACTNHYRERREPVKCSRYAGFRSSMEKISRAEKREKKMSVAGAFEMLAEASFSPSGGCRITTYHSIVFEPGKRRMSVCFSKGRASAPRQKPLLVGVSSLLKRPKPESPSLGR